MPKTAADIRVADEVWIATALLHQEHAERADFTVQEIVGRARRENVHGTLRPGVQVHAYSHCVANVPPATGRYRMLFATGKATRRLYRYGDPAHPERRSGKTVPARADIPPDYHHLLDWYATTYSPSRDEDPILSMRGLGEQIWRDEEADAYVARLREGWA
jgi:hypothetical protein